jgi:hypothetical protein
MVSAAEDDDDAGVGSVRDRGTTGEGDVMAMAELATRVAKKELPT